MRRKGLVSDPRDPLPQGCGNGAYRDIFTACPGDRSPNHTPAGNAKGAGIILLVQSSVSRVSHELHRALKAIQKNGPPPARRRRVGEGDGWARATGGGG